MSLTDADPALLGILKMVRESTAIYVASNRDLIASGNARAHANGGRYNPPQDLLADIVIVSCGDEDFGERLECARLVVATRDGKRIQPSSYSSGPRAYRNALGATWTVRKVLATFSAAALKNGFVVTAAEPDGTEWTLEVSPSEAEERLLLRVGDPPPERLNVSLEPYADGWRLWNNSDGFTWTGCAATLGTSTAMIGALIPKWKGPVTFLKFDDFKPTQGRRHDPAPTVACLMVGKMYEAAVTIEAP